MIKKDSQKLKAKLIDKWLSRMHKANKTQFQLAELAGISNVQLSNITRYKVLNPQMRTIEKIEKALEGLGV